MTSIEWKKIIDDLTSEITTKERRLGEIVRAKAAAITDHKRLTALEHEEMALPAATEILKRRLPLLNQAHEAALKVEAAERHREIEKLGEAAAAAVNESTAGIRATMQELLNKITEAHDTWQTHGLLAAEGEYLRVRFGLAPLQIPPGERVTAEERARFVRQFENLLRVVPSTQPWNHLRAEWQAEKQRQEAQHRRDEDAKLPQIPVRIDYRDNHRQGSERHQEEQRHVDETANHPTIFTHYTDHLIGRSH